MNAPTREPRAPDHLHDHDHGVQARALLRQAKLRVTSARLAVLTALLDSHRPTTTQELIDAISAAGNTDIDDVTIYRTVNVLVEAGIAQPVGTTDRGRRFEVHACEGCRVGHPHLECRGCGAMQCLEGGDGPVIILPPEIAGFLVQEAQLYLYGLCAACRKT